MRPAIRAAAASASQAARPRRRYGPEPKTCYESVYTPATAVKSERIMQLSTCFSSTDCSRLGTSVKTFSSIAARRCGPLNMASCVSGESRAPPPIRASSGTAFGMALMRIESM
mmetsp:Transcript_45402/g.119958  ORF Transcript_45402/g.119958 Transcript_45402/m.119958 type:complete len:113 (-) Transcript_45402:532-870(-)